MNKITIKGSVTDPAMRIWTIHPRFLDKKGLGGQWREALLCRGIVEEKRTTGGFARHPQGHRFRIGTKPGEFDLGVTHLNYYLHLIYGVASRKYNYNYNREFLKLHHPHGCHECKHQLTLPESTRSYQPLQLSDTSHHHTSASPSAVSASASAPAPSVSTPPLSYGAMAVTIGQVLYEWTHLIHAIDRPNRDPKQSEFYSSIAIDLSYDRPSPYTNQYDDISLPAWMDVNHPDHLGELDKYEELRSELLAKQVESIKSNSLLSSGSLFFPSKKTLHQWDTIYTDAHAPQHQSHDILNPLDTDDHDNSESLSLSPKRKRTKRKVQNAKDSIDTMTLASQSHAADDDSIAMYPLPSSYTNNGNEYIRVIHINDLIHPLFHIVPGGVESMEIQRPYPRGYVKTFYGRD